MTACRSVHDLLPEFALGLLGGDDRAAVVEHLGGCAACRDDVAALVVASDEVVAALADADPPAGFEGRVFARLDGAATRSTPALADRRRGRLVLLGIAAALLLVVGAAVVASVLADRAEAPRPTAARTAPMRTPQGRTVGQASVTGRPAAVLLVAPNWADGSSGTYRLRVVLRSGSVRDRGPVVLDEGYAGYGVPGVAAADVRRIEMIATDGTVACSADFR